MGGATFARRLTVFVVAGSAIVGTGACTFDTGPETAQTTASPESSAPSSSTTTTAEPGVTIAFGDASVVPGDPRERSQPPATLHLVVTLTNRTDRAHRIEFEATTNWGRSRSAPHEILEPAAVETWEVVFALGPETVPSHVTAFDDDGSVIAGTEV